MPIRVAEWSKAWVCSRSPAKITGSNTAGGMDVCLLWVLCVVRYRSLRRADLSSRGVPPTVVVWLCVITWNNNPLHLHRLGRKRLDKEEDTLRIFNRSHILLLQNGNHDFPDANTSMAPVTEFLEILLLTCECDWLSLAMLCNFNVLKYLILPSYLLAYIILTDYESTNRHTEWIPIHSTACVKTTYIN